MNKTILSTALVASLMALPAASFAGETGSWFIGAQTGQSKLLQMTASHGTDTGYAISGGYRWIVNPAIDVGAEVGYANLGSFSDGFYSPGYATPGKVTAKVKGAFAGANMRFFFNRNWYVLAQTGYFNAHSKINTRLGTYYDSMKTTKSSWYSGIGVGYRFDNNTSLGFVFNHFDDRTGQYDLASSLASVRLEVEF
ncbi:outer membrane beta-barrel protein [Oleiagrimonas sp.]|jgi:OOP family OmpA-OmpF porin|uniref:outer membrane beta-barrel protein n=1 Tax=Oleiagrimonas sp. TaxID=2010330 RepID=UPI002627AFA2|nr:outer membrane beta-barrel protein [Oleiagrimonas sp.]MDA3914790.1 outer membrane beta-barrel protein [Oleiagrimonas sp.]